ncbi:helix-turn-helix domain-containing protein [Streptomyces sp. MBT65]|uniref:helix-turn-helix domain-containing protein n=1 Tax=Streptomyces sp. MBT65 TaxID=1488395 RepID=UPI0027DA6EED|nr:helix-turn-helix domain-containing protein [Streptomyces sp. MBT65]
MRRKGSPGEVLGWLGRWIGADVAWLGRGGVVEAATDGFSGELLGALDGELDRVVGGRLAAAATQVGGMEVRLEAFGGREPRAVLVTVSASALSREAAALASQAGGLLELLGRALEADDSSRGYEEKARQLRFAVLTVLMTGDVMLARRVSTGEVPGLLSAERVRVHVLQCPPADRDRLARTYQDPSGYHGKGLMVHCPAFREHLICPIAEDADEDVDEDPGDGFLRGEVLRRLVRENPGYALGISRPHPLAATGAAYGEALHALAVARNSPERLAAYPGEPALMQLLPRAEAVAWARAFVEPLSVLPRHTVDVVRLAVTFPRTAVARLLQISRNTVAAYCRRAAETLALDLDDVHARATLDLALSLATLSPDPAVRVPQVVPSLAELLRCAPATTWAESFLRPLGDARHHRLSVTLGAWIDANTDARQTAERLGMSRNTVRVHLRTAERLLNRDLLTTGSGIHDLVHALRVTGEHRTP